MEVTGPELPIRVWIREKRKKDARLFMLRKGKNKETESLFPRWAPLELVAGNRELELGTGTERVGSRGGGRG